MADDMAPPADAGGEVGLNWPQEGDDLVVRARKEADILRSIVGSSVVSRAQQGHVATLLDLMADALAARAREAEGWRARVVALEADVEYAAGECLVPLPEPGSDLARVCLANRQLGRQRDAAEREVADLRARCERLEGGREALAAEREAAMKYMAGRGVGRSYLRTSEDDPIIVRNLTGMVVALEERRAFEVRCEEQKQQAATQARAAEPAVEATHGE